MGFGRAEGDEHLAWVHLLRETEVNQLYYQGRLQRRTKAVPTVTAVLSIVDGRLPGCTGCCQGRLQCPALPPVAQLVVSS